MALRIREWRWVSGQWRLVGEVIRDMQINVETCPNEPPVVVVPADTCILQGETLNFTVSASDPNGDNVTVTAIGGPFEGFEPEAEFAGTRCRMWGPSAGPPGAMRCGNRLIKWCSRRRTGRRALSDVETVNVTVIPRPVTATAAAPIGNAVEVDWPVHPCAGTYSTALQGVGGYEVYRRIGSEEVTSETCEVGMPAGAGYQLLTTVQGWATTPTSTRRP